MFVSTLLRSSEWCWEPHAPTLSKDRKRITRSIRIDRSSTAPCPTQVWYCPPST